MSHIFISHSSKDNRFTQRLEKALTNANLKVWVDYTNNRSSEEWVMVIEKALRECDQIIVVISTASLNSFWVRSEILRALKLNKRIHVLVIDPNIDDVNMPLIIAGLQYINMRNSRKHKQGFEELIESIQRRLPVLSWPQPDKPLGKSPTIRKAPKDGDPKAVPPTDDASKEWNYYYKGWQGWGNIISLVECTDIREGWRMEDVTISHMTIQFHLNEKTRAAYDAYFQNNYDEKGFKTDNTRIMLQKLPAVFIDSPSLSLNTLETKYSVTKFFSEEIAHGDRQTYERLLGRLLEKEQIEFAHAFCMHAIIATNDDHILLVQRTAGVGYYPLKWQCSLSEQLDAEDLNMPKPVLHWGKRMLHEELGLKSGFDDYNMKILSIFLETDLLNISACAYITLELNKDKLDRHIKYGIRKDHEFRAHKFIPSNTLENVLFETTKDYHPAAAYLMRMALMHHSPGQ